MRGLRFLARSQRVKSGSRVSRLHPPWRTFASALHLRETFTSDVHVGYFRRLVNGTRSVWVRCPAAVASGLATRGGMVIGWANVRIDDFKVRPTQCFRCWHFGHVRNTCRSTTDRTGYCFRCGESGHLIRDCTSEPKCVVCSDNKFNTGHRLGPMNCASLNRRLAGRAPDGGHNGSNGADK